MAKESRFQRNLIGKIQRLLPGCMVMKLDANYIQGVPDLLILYCDKWAALECKRDERASFQPNQPYYISEMDKMSFARVIFPENEREVLNELQQALKPERSTRFS